MATKLFKTMDLVELVYEGSYAGLEVISDIITGTSRWAIQHELIFMDNADGKLYQTTYQVGSTELQDEGPFEYDGPYLECSEVIPVEKTIIVYEVAP